MLFTRNGSIRSILTILVTLSILPAFVIIFYSGFLHRQELIENATQKVALTVRGMAEHQKAITRSTREILLLLSKLPEIQQLNIRETRRILSDLVDINPHYKNLALVALDGSVITAGKGDYANINLADRKHFREALKNNGFAIGEFVIARVGAREPVFPAAIPVLDNQGKPKAVLTMVLKLSSFANYIEPGEVPEGSFVAMTDSDGIRLFYYPAKKDTNPVGKPIRGKSWEYARNAREPGIFTSYGSDGKKRIFAFEPVSLTAGESPYMYVWSGIPEKHILSPVNTATLNNLLMLGLAFIVALLLARIIGEKTIIAPLLNLVQLAEQFSKGNLKARSDSSTTVSEFNVLSDKFDQMAESLQKSNEKLSRLSLVDGLTNIANRRMFDLKLEEEWNRLARTKRPLSLLMIDIDCFKNYNDSYGHLAGDDCLRTISLILKNIANRSTDLAARYGGEEFAMILPETEAQGAYAIADSIHALVAQSEILHESSGISQYLTVSIGLALVVEASGVQSPKDLIKLADQQLYKSKQAGRNRTSGIELT